ncbi:MULTISPECIES: hypothetical protein [unclassified Streptomyces]|uniref:hypothetical protein n=1 Tax=unclassified Streptomyces TaxID=2593676 RepID=UPI0034244A7B
MRRTRRVVALVAVLAALGTAPATAALGRAAGHAGTAVHADAAPGSPSAPFGTTVRYERPRVAGSGASPAARAEHGDDHGRDGKGGQAGGQDGKGGKAGGQGGPGREGGRVRTRDAGPADPFVVVASAAAGVGALVALVLSVSRALRRRRD